MEDEEEEEEFVVTKETGSSEPASIQNKMLEMAGMSTEVEERSESGQHEDNGVNVEESKSSLGHETELTSDS